MNAKNIKHRGLAVAIAVAALFAAQGASADQIQLSGWWGGNTWDAQIAFTGTNYHDGSATTLAEGGGAGGFQTNNLTTGDSFQSWCVDIFHNFYFPTSTSDNKVTAASVFGLTKANDLGRLYKYVHTLPLAHPISSTASSNADAAAFQMAVWEIVNEGAGTYNLGAGNFRVSGTGAGEAQGWLDYLNANPDSTNAYKDKVEIWSVQNQGPNGWGAQDVAVFAPVPEPETYAMMLAGLALMGFVARRRMHADAV